MGGITLFEEPHAKFLGNGKKRQGTTLVVPPEIPNKSWALAPASLCLQLLAHPAAAKAGIGFGHFRHD
jgi:hypothetical protein